jgi:hypothetical protein
MRAFALSILALLTLTACSGVKSPPTTNEKQIEIMRTVWQNRRAGLNYTIEYRELCFCATNADRIRVTTNTLDQKTLVQLIDANGDIFAQYGPESDLSQYLNIEDFYIRLTDDWAAAAILSVNFDEAYGHPTSIFVNHNPAFADGERTYEITLVEFF